MTQRLKYLHLVRSRLIDKKKLKLPLKLLLYNNYSSNTTNNTDKHTKHSYIPEYEKLFYKIRNRVKNVLEIGISGGHSLKLWSDYFIYSKIYGIDKGASPNWLGYYPRIITYKNDAYNTQFISKVFENRNLKFDIIIDDGPHTKESMIFTAKYYTKLLTKKGILIIEDVQNINWFNDIKKAFGPELSDNVTLLDLRKKKNRYDDILIILRL